MKRNENIYVGIDFSKEKFNACLILEDGSVMGECELPNTRAGYLKLVRWTKKVSEMGKAFNASCVLYCGEHTGTYSTALADYLHGKGFRIWLENALMIKHGSGFQRGKSDAADAEMIAVYAKNFYCPGKTHIYQPATQVLRVLRSLYKFRQRIVMERVAMSNIMASHCLDDCRMAREKLSLRHSAAMLDEGVVTKEMIRVMSESPALSRNYAILTSFKGIGPVTAAMFLIYTGNFTRFDNPRKFACYCGLAPFGSDSGTSVHSTPRVSHFAQHDVKAALTEVAKSAIRFNPAIRRYADRLHAKGKHNGVVLNNVKDKIIHIIFKMVADGTLWNPDYGKKGDNRESEPEALGGQKKRGSSRSHSLSEATEQPSPSALTGDKRNEGAAAATPSTEATVQPSPSALGGDAKLTKKQQLVHFSTNSSQKICILT